MYCTLQEAYNVPSFDPPPRKKKCSPDVQARASADAYEPYRRDGGNGTGDFTMYKYTTPKGVPQHEPVQGNKPLQRRIPYESFQNYGQGGDPNPTLKPLYKGMENDRRQYCKSYGVCAADQMETFINGSAEDYGSGAGLNTSAGAGQPSSVGGGNGTCQSSPDFYEVPLSDETKKQFQKAMNTALDQRTSSTKEQEPSLRYDDMHNVTGYYDEDLEQYLKSSEASSIPKRMPMNADAKPNDVLHNPNSSPLQRTIKRFSEHSIQEPLKPEKLSGSGSDSYVRRSYSYDYDDLTDTKSGRSYAWDILLFILAGVLIIILIDQLFKMGVLLGMRHTMEILEPYMKELREIAKK